MGQEQRLCRGDAASAPAMIGLVVDSSGSIRTRREQIADAVKAFVGMSRPLDEFFTVHFNDAVWLGLPPSVPFTADRRRLSAAIATVPAEGMSALYDGLDRALGHLALATRDHKALVVLGDGGDNASAQTQAMGASSSCEPEQVIMRGHSEGGARRRRDTALGWVARLLVIAGIATLAWCGVLLTDAYVAQRIARQSLEAIPSVDAPAGLPVPATVQTAPSIVRSGAAIASLSIPRVALSAVVLHGSDDQTLRRGPGHLEGTAMPGHAGNVVIAGHRDSFRLTYNARLIRRNDHRPGGLLEFRTCDLIIDGDQAAAHCGTASESAEDDELHIWTSTLQRTGATWTIKQIVSAD
jgi:hypothetical protein